MDKESGLAEAAAAIPDDVIPAQEESTQPTEPTTGQPVEATEEAPAQETEQAPEQEVQTTETDTPTPVEDSSTASEEVEEDVAYQPQYQPQPIDFSQLPQDADGNVDAQAFAQAMQNQQAEVLAAAREQARAEFAEQRREEKAWDKAMETYPQLKENKDLRDMVQSARIGSFTDRLSRGVANPKLEDPKAVAEKLFKHITTAKKEGYEQAQTNVKVQEGAHLETSNVQSNEKATTQSNAWEHLGSSNPHETKQAVDSILKDMFDKGTLKI